MAGLSMGVELDVAAVRTDLSLVDFVRGQYPSLVRTLSLFVGERELAEDLAQEALARACRDWAKVQRLDDPSSWVRRVGFNLAKSHFRRHKIGGRVLARLEARTPAVEHPADPTDMVAVRRAVASLPMQQRTALVLRYFEDLPVAEVAAVMGCPEGTVKSLTSRAIDRLRELGLGQLENPDD